MPEADFSSASEAVTEEEISAPVSETEASEVVTTEETVCETTVTEPEETEEVTEESETETVTETEEPEKTDIYDYDYSRPVPESLYPKDSSYYDTCAFVGDSHTNGLGAYGFVDQKRIFAKDGLSIKNIGESVSPSGIAAIGPENVYLMMGTNGVAWLKSEDMISSYESFVNEIKAYLPDSNIYILSIPPVSYDRSTTTDAKKNISIDKINTYNAALQEMAADNRWYFVDTFSAVCNESGYLDSSMTNDGVHMKKELYRTFTDYILSHTVY